MPTLRPGAISLAATSGIALTLVTVNVLPLRWIQNHGFDVWNLSALRNEVRVNDERTQVMEARLEQIRRETAVTGCVARNLIEGSTTLVKATDDLEPMLRHREGYEWRSLSDPPPTFRHAVARLVMSRVELELQSDPDRREIVSARLKAEYDAMK